MAAGTETKYELLKLLNQEFTFDVDVSKLPCGLNGALYFSEMDADGGMAKFSANKAGAKYGTGYCDAQCPRDLKFINGQANAEGWGGSSNDANAGFGKYGACCTEMDIWEANSISAAYTPHPCTGSGLTRCTGTDCGVGDRYASLCDADGCDFNSYRQGDTSFYGPGKTIDTTQKLTVVTQFISSDGTANGDLVEIKRFYVQNGVTYANSQSTYPTAPGNSITDAFCAAQKSTFGDQNIHLAKGGLKKMGQALKNGMVLVMSIWDDHSSSMLWLDAPFPATKDASEPGVSRGSCSRDSGKPEDVEKNSPDASVTFSNIKWGPLGSTFNGGGTNPPVSTRLPTSTRGPSSTRPASSTRAPTSTPATGGGMAPHWGQCGGQGWTGPTGCQSPWTCTVSNQWYSQCL
jgi:cellulose 1,4-beta-cellobiosidase